MDDFKTEKWTLEDGRRAERRVVENKSTNGQSERVVELHVEDERPLRLQQRVVEKSKPIVFERKIETIDPKTGNVLEQKVESIEPKTQMQLVEHIATQEVSAQSIKEDCDCHVTKEEMINTIVAAIKATRETPVAQSKNLVDHLNSFGLVAEVGNKIEKPKSSTLDKIMLAVIVIQVIGLGCILFFM